MDKFHLCFLMTFLTSSIRTKPPWILQKRWGFCFLIIWNIMSNVVTCTLYTVQCTIQLNWVKGRYFEYAFTWLRLGFGNSGDVCGVAKHDMEKIPHPILPQVGRLVVGVWAWPGLGQEPEVTHCDRSPLHWLLLLFLLLLLHIIVVVVIVINVIIIITMIPIIHTVTMILTISTTPTSYRGKI